MASPAVTTPLPQPGLFVDAVRTSARAAREAAGIRIDHTAAEHLLRAPAFTETFKRLSQTHGVLFPFQFPSAGAELNFVSVLSLLNFGSGYRAPLHAAAGRGAYDSIRALLFSLYLSSAPETGGTDWLSARGMQAIDIATVAEMMNVKIHEERPHKTIPGLTVGALGGPVYELVKLLTGAMNSTGEVLVQGGYPDLGAFVAEALREGERTGHKNADGALGVVVERLVRAFPALRDISLVNGQPVYCFKKAMILTHAVALRFGGDGASPPFPIADTTHAPIFVDNVIPSMLVHFGVLDLSGAALGLAAAFPPAALSRDTLLASAPVPDAVDAANAAKEVHGRKRDVRDGPELTVEQAFALRAAAIDACEEMVKLAHGLDLGLDADVRPWMKTMTPAELDAWLWAVAKDREDYRALDRFVLRNTVFF